MKSSARILLIIILLLGAGNNSYAQVPTCCSAFISIRHSVYNISKANELTYIDLQSGCERKKMADSMKHSGEYGLKMQKLQACTFSGIGGVGFILLFSFLFYFSYKQKK
jgi:hypothetical protein